MESFHAIGVIGFGNIYKTVSSTYLTIMEVDIGILWPEANSETPKLLFPISKDFENYE